MSKYIIKGENCREGNFTLVAFVKERKREIKSKRCQSSLSSKLCLLKDYKSPLSFQTSTGAAGDTNKHLPASDAESKVDKFATEYHESLSLRMLTLGFM